jgi:hypothetical protein
MFTIDGKIGGVTVAFGEPGEAAALGATSLETLGLAVDTAEKLVPRDFRA